MKSNRRSLATLGVAGAIALGAVPALAQVGDTPTTDESTESTTREERMATRNAAFAEALAAELDLPVDQVSAAVDTVRAAQQAEHDAECKAALQARLDEAVANGERTQAEADPFATAAEAGVLPGGRRGRRGHRVGGHGPGGLGG